MDQNSFTPDERMLTGEEIVISGISGSFPQAENTQKLIQNLYDKVDMIKKYDSNDINHPEMAQHCGEIEDLNRFDSNFFRFTPWQAASFDPIGRKNMEQAYSAIFDADEWVGRDSSSSDETTLGIIPVEHHLQGLNPETLKGTKMGVFIGASQSDSVTLALYDAFNSKGFVISGCSKTMLANRISYWIDAKGPSYGLDYACASSIACLEIAFERMKAGDCDSAIVGGCNHSFHPVLQMNMRRAGMLCLDGKTKCFDKNGDGYVRSSAINLMFLQKAKDAKRIYAEVYHVKGKYFSPPDATFLPTRRSEDIEKFLKEFYSEVDVFPNEVEYVESNSAGIAEADEKELIAIGNIFGKTNPIKVGSIKSNMGHTQPASGVCSLTKICLSYQRGEIPGNLHYNEPLNQIAAIREGNIQVVTENTKFNRSFTALNNFSYTGANYHVLLKGHYKPKDTKRYKSEIPYLVLTSGRLDENVTKIQNILENSPIDPEQIALLNNIFKYDLPGHTGRGYTIIETNDEKRTTCLAKGFEIYDGSTRPVWFLYSGMGSQWTTMGAELMRLPMFAATIKRCQEVLLSKQVDIIKIITDDDKDIFDNILNSFVGITAIQIALTDVLKSLGIAPDNIIGHSAGEIGCAYGDGSLTLEEAMLLAYFRGLVSLETKMIKGKMAAIGLGHIETRKLCPPEIDIACINSPQSTTISGPAEDIEKFVAFLTERSIFARIVASSGIAYHSRYISEAGPSLLSKMRDVVKNPKARSKIWLSTCFTPDQWTEETSLFASPEYFTHNILNTVHFEEAAKMIPRNAIVIEIAPHGLMQAIMKRSHESCMNLSLTRRGEKNNIKLLLQTIGTLYQAGLNPDVAALYPKVEFPVSTETSVLTHFVGWDHTVDWHTDDFIMRKKLKTISYEYLMSIQDDDYSFYQGCIRNGVIVFPEAAILVTVWKTLAMYNGMDYRDTPVRFTNVKFHKSVFINLEEALKLSVEIQKGTNMFEVTQNNDLVASGFISLGMKVIERFDDIQFVESDYHLNEKDIYNLMSSRGYSNEGLFKSIRHTNITRNKGLLKWNNNWITFLDSLFQLNALSKEHDGESNLKLITKLVIDVDAQKKAKKTLAENDVCYGAQIFHNNAVTKCGGVLLTSIAFDDTPKATHNMMEKLQMRKFFPHSPQYGVELQTAVQVNLQIISERIRNKIIIHYIKSDFLPNLQNVLKEVVEAIPSLDMEFKVIPFLDSIALEDKPDVLILHNLDKIDRSIFDALSSNFVIAISCREKLMSLHDKFSAVTKYRIGELVMILFEKSTSAVLGDKRGGYYYIPAQVKSKLQNVKLITSNVCEKHAWAEVPSIPNKNTIQVVYSGVYTNDYKVNGQLKKTVNKNGVSFSGINARGEKVMGVLPDGSVSSLVEENNDFIWPVPKHWNFEEAATVPLPFIQAYYCLGIRGNLRKRSNVYITKGDSALGQAAISLCLHLNCSVFATVSNIQNKNYLMNIFRNLEESHIGFIDDVSFRHHVLSTTKNKRCDFVINSDKGSIRQEAMSFVGFGGTFLDINDHDMIENENYCMAFNTQSRTYMSVRLLNIFKPEHSNDCKKLQQMFAEGVSNGSVRPLPHVFFPAGEISRAFKLLSTDNSICSVLIKFNMKEPANLKEDFMILPRIELSPSKSYIVICDGTELGIELIEHLMQRGARRFLIHMKPKLMNGYFHVKYASWKNNYNAIINFNSEDLHTKSACENLITQGVKLGSIDGIFVTRNEMINDESGQIDHDVTDISLIASNLDSASRNCPLSYFSVIFCTSQDYNLLAFSEIEKCCIKRSEIGLPSLIIRYESNDKKMSSQALSKLYTALETSLKQNYTSVFLSDSKPKSRLYFDEKTGIEVGLGAFFNKISEDEYTATEPIISMKTQLNYENENELYLEPDDTYVWLVPGFDGNYQTLTSVVERLKTPAITLQLEPDLVTSIPDIAKKLLTIVKKRFNMKSKFYILGYSFGVNVALEIAALLEKEGRFGVVFCLDSSPDSIKKQLIAVTGNMTDQQLQNSVIEHFYNLLTGGTSEELKENSAKTLEWSEKINMFVDKVKGSVSYTHQFLKAVINMAYRRIVMAKDYEPDFKLESEIVLMKCIPHQRFEKLADDYGLSKYSNKPVKVFKLETNHVNAPQDVRVSNIINKMLDPELLEEFENKNLCQYNIA